MIYTANGFLPIADGYFDLQRGGGHTCVIEQFSLAGTVEI